MKDIPFVSAPFSLLQIEAIQRYQNYPFVHSLTCRYRDHGGDDVLVPKIDGLHCPTCGYVQTTVFKEIANSTESYTTNPLEGLT